MDAGKRLPTGAVFDILGQRGALRRMETLKNRLVRLTVTGTTNEGSGVGHTQDGMTVFVPLTAVGDVAECRLVKVQKRYAYGKIERLLVPSPDRVPDPGCPVYGRCGGCAWRHIRYEAECRYKRRQVDDAFERVGGFAAEVAPVLAGNPSRYRNKAQFPVGRCGGNIAAGFYSPRSHRLVPVSDCPLQPEEFAPLADAVLRWMESAGADPYDENTGRGLVRHIYLRKAQATGQVMLCPVCATDRLPKIPLLIRLAQDVMPDVRICVNIHPAKTNVILGERTLPLTGDGIEDEICRLRVRLGAQSFYQVNRAQAQRLYELAAQMADLCREDTLLDLYCGAGIIGLSMAHRVRRVIGVETVARAVEDARQNAAANGIANADFFCADAAEASLRLEKEGVRPDVVLLDPPRKGIDAALLETVVRWTPRRVVYLSCDPATLARDCARFATLGYTPGRVVPVDLFPRTRHVECVTVLSRGQGNTEGNTLSGR